MDAPTVSFRQSPVFELRVHLSRGKPEVLSVEANADRPLVTSAMMEFINRWMRAQNFRSQLLARTRPGRFLARRKCLQNVTRANVDY